MFGLGENEIKEKQGNVKERRKEKEKEIRFFFCLVTSENYKEV